MILIGYQDPAGVIHASPWSDRCGFGHRVVVACSPDAKETGVGYRIPTVNYCSVCLGMTVQKERVA